MHIVRHCISFCPIRLRRRFLNIFNNCSAKRSISNDLLNSYHWCVLHNEEPNYACRMCDTCAFYFYYVLCVLYNIIMPIGLTVAWRIFLLSFRVDNTFGICFISVKNFRLHFIKKKKKKTLGERRFLFHLQKLWCERKVSKYYTWCIWFQNWKFVQNMAKFCEFVHATDGGISQRTYYYYIDE